MAALQETVTQVASLDASAYKYGFTTDIESEKAPKGLNEDIVRFIYNFVIDFVFFYSYQLFFLQLMYELFDLQTYLLLIILKIPANLTYI